MSVKVMSAVWDRDDLDPYEKLVLLSLADHANDEGECYPSIRRLCERTGMGERGTQGVIKRLCDKQLLSVEYGAGRGGSNLYRVDLAPRTTCTPAPDAGGAPDAPHPRTGCAAPPHPITSTPAPGAPKPSRTTKEPSGNRQSRAKARRSEIIEILSQVASQHVAEEFEAHRRETGKSMTARAARMIANNLAGHHDPDAVLNLSIQNGWQGVFPDKVRPQLIPINGGLSHDHATARGGYRRNSDADTSAQRIAFAATARRAPDPDWI